MAHQRSAYNFDQSTDYSYSSFERGGSDHLSSKGFRGAYTHEVTSHRSMSNAAKQDGASFSFESFLRAVRLQTLVSLYRTCRRRRVEEPPKIAVSTSYWSAIFTSVFLHLIPVAVSMTIIVFNLQQYYIGAELAGKSGQDPQKLFALQVAAKLLELLILASLSNITFANVRHHLAAGNAVPFGILSAGLEIDKLSYLWSKEFVAIWRANFTASPIRALWISMLAAFTILGATVGPSAATGLKPQLDSWAAGGTDIWFNTTELDIFPLNVNVSQVLGPTCLVLSNEPRCPAFGLEGWENTFLRTLPYVLGSGSGLRRTVPESIQLPASTSAKTMVLGFRGRELYSQSTTTATTQHNAIAEAISETARLWAVAANAATEAKRSRLQYRAENTFSIASKQPFVTTTCQSSIVQPNDKTTYKFPVTGKSSDITYQAWENTALKNWIASAFQIDSKPDILWVDLPADQFPSTSIGAVISLPANSANSSQANSTKLNGSALNRIYSCAIHAKWAESTATSKRFPRRNIQSTTGKDAGFITISPGWAEYLNPRITADSKTHLIERLSVSAGVWTPLPKSDVLSNVEIVESMIAPLIASGLARTAPLAQMQGELIGYDKAAGVDPWVWEFLPKDNKVFGAGGNAYDISSEKQKTLFKLTMRAYVQGYAYSHRGPAARLSVTVLIAYVLVATIHIIYTIVRSHETSSSWDSAAELTALALASEYPEELKNTTAGIFMIDTLKRPVKIVSVDDHVELSFETRELTDDKKLKKNHLYS